MAEQAPAVAQNSAIIDVPRNGTQQQQTQAQPVNPFAPAPVVTPSQPASVTGTESQPTQQQGRDWRIDQFYASNARITQLEAELAAVKANQQQPATQQTQQETAPVWDPEKWANKGGYDAFVNEVSQYNIKQALKDERANQQKLSATEQQRIAEAQKLVNFNQRMQTVQAQVADYHQVIAAAPVRIGGDQSTVNTIRDAILEDPNGPQLCYHLAKNPNDMIALNALPSMTRKLAYLGKLSEQYTPAVAQGGGSPQLPAAASTAPNPVQGINPSSATPKARTPQSIAGSSQDKADVREFAAASGITVQKHRFLGR